MVSYTMGYGMPQSCAMARGDGSELRLARAPVATMMFAQGCLLLVPSQ